MSEWYTTEVNTPTARWPNENFVRWVDENYGKHTPYLERAKITFMELGSGSGADLRMLKVEGFTAEGIDSNPKARARWHEDISFITTFKAAFDCVYSLNVLCHVENPPYWGIAEALKPSGKFYAIVPAMETEADLEGKGFTRLYSPSSIRHQLEPVFSRIDIGANCYRHRQRNYHNWVIEADK